MKEGKDYKLIPMTSFSSGEGIEVAHDVYYYTNQIVNVIFIGEPGRGGWTMIDAGMPKSGTELMEVAMSRFGADAKPAAILLTHGHFDHVGSLVPLLEQWRVPLR